MGQGSSWNAMKSKSQNKARFAASCRRLSRFPVSVLCSICSLHSDDVVTVFKWWRRVSVGHYLGGCRSGGTLGLPWARIIPRTTKLFLRFHSVIQIEGSQEIYGEYLFGHIHFTHYMECYGPCGEIGASDKVPVFSN